mmetsp:Transcript_62424/g.103835  ORF Transcript_62424/g.103835 Transcript_62424/m.103835 type:complete len:153 (+) Transcript_62424:243-701(+)
MVYGQVNLCSGAPTATSLSCHPQNITASALFSRYKTSALGASALGISGPSVLLIGSKTRSQNIKTQNIKKRTTMPCVLSRAAVEKLESATPLKAFWRDLLRRIAHLLHLRSICCLGLRRRLTGRLGGRLGGRLRGRLRSRLGSELLARYRRC